MTSADGIIEAFGRIRSFQQNGQRAPHKPLVLLLALAALQRGDERWLDFNEHEAKLRQLLIDFGPDQISPRPEYPFWRLQNDGIWTIPQAGELEQSVNASGDVPVTRLRDVDAQGGFPEEIFRFLRSRPELVNTLAAQILERSFPASLHNEVLDAVGFPWTVVTRQRRDPAFRDSVLRIYERRCAVCGYDGRLGAADLALEAAHVKWHAAGGPDSLDNGVALCSFHHVAFDRGAITIDDEMCIQVSQHVVGHSEVELLLLRFVGAALRPPQAGTPTLHPSYLDWHRGEVFRKPARHAS